MLRDTVEAKTACLWWLLSTFLLTGITWGNTRVQVIAGALSGAFLILAAYVDSVVKILPDPLLLLALFCAWVGSPHKSSALVLGCTSWGICCLMCRWSSLGKGDAKLVGVLCVLIGEVKIAALSILGAVLTMGACAATLLFTARIHRYTTLALGPSLVCSGVATWCLTHATLI